LTCATTAYSPLSNTAPVQYIQKNATADLLRSIANANANALSQLHVSQSHATLDQALRPDSTLHELANFGATRPEYSWLVFQALWKELTATAPDPSFAGAKGFQRRPPMVITVDNLSHWMTNSLYFSAEYKPIHAHDLTLVRHFLSILSSPSALPSGGLALYATSTNNRPLTPALDVCIKQVSARNAGVQPTSAQFPLPDPYAKLDARVMAYFNEIHAKSPDLVVAQELRGVSKEETRGLLEFYARSGILRQRISEEVVAEKWTLAGGGILGELNKFGKRMHALN
jgi:small subunit ribosomal protein S29